MNDSARPMWPKGLPDLSESLAGDCQPVLWKGRAAIFRREVGDGEHAEVVIEGRVYRVRIGELR
jgi:hypothetical protein